MSHPQIAAFARLAQENATPTRTLSGQKTLLGRTIHDIRYDEIHDEFMVTNPLARAILIYKGGSGGEEPPVRVIQGSKTGIIGADRLEVDPVHNEILIPEGDHILVYSRTANGNVAPLRVLEGPDTQLMDAEALVVDPVNNLLFVGTQDRRMARGGGSILVYNRTASGNTKPIRVIHGPKTGIVRIKQMEVYPPKGWLLAAMPGRQDLREQGGVFVGVWHVNDNGDVAPRWKLGGEKSLLKRPNGMALIPEHKEISIPDMRHNAVLTYYFPEIF